MKAKGPKILFIYNRGQQIPGTNLNGEKIVMGTWNSKSDKDHVECYIRDDSGGGGDR